MSHVAGVECYANDLDALRLVGEELGLELILGDGVTKMHFKWYESWVGGGDDRYTKSFRFE